MSASNPQIPSSILIVGSGVFGLSTAYALAQRPDFQSTKITLLERLEFPAVDGSSIDASRIIRADYPDWAYASLMAEGFSLWRGDFGAEGRYTESGLCLVIGGDDKGGNVDHRDGTETAAGQYLQKALKTVTSTLGLRAGRRADGGQVTPFNDEASAREAMGTTGGLIGTKGYVNWTSGWAHAENAMRYLRERVAATGRVEFRTAEVSRLLFDHGRTRVEGVELVGGVDGGGGGERLTADLTLLATGAWTPKLLDLRGIASATGQILAYVKLSDAEQERLAKNPVILCESDGFFIIPPTDGVLKVARHGYGYANPVTIAHPEREGEEITVSLPRTKVDDAELNIAPEGLAGCRQFLAKCIPDLADRPWTHTRICWYTDTPKGDWLIDYHPRYKGLLVATGGSGHAYKFLPVIGQRIADIIQGQERDKLGAELRKRWRWPTEKTAEDHVWTTDWRGGKKGMILDEELAKKQT